MRKLALSIYMVFCSIHVVAAQKAYMDPVRMNELMLNECIGIETEFGQNIYGQTNCYKESSKGLEILMNKYYNELQGSSEVSQGLKANIKAEQLTWINQKNKTIKENEKFKPQINISTSETDTTPHYNPDQELVTKIELDSEKIKYKLLTQRVAELQEYCVTAGINIYD